MFSSTGKCIESECLVFFVKILCEPCGKNLTTKDTRKNTIGHNE